MQLRILAAAVCAGPALLVSRSARTILHASRLILALAVLGLLAAQPAAADTLGFSTAQTGNYLLIGTGDGVSFDAVDVGNRRIGGNIAATHSNGRVTLSNVTVNGTIDVGTSSSSNVNLSNTTHGGVNFSTNFTQLMSDLSVAKSWINGLSATQTRPADIKGNFTFHLQAGLNVIDLGQSGSDFKIEGDGPSKETVTIMKAPGVTDDVIAIFRVVNGKSMITSQVIIDNQTGSHDNVLFYSDSSKDSPSIEAFNLSNMRTFGGSPDVAGILHIAFWALGENAEININNALGCTQLIADKINLNNVDFDLCAFGPPDTTVIPLPPAVLMGAALLGVVGGGHLRRWRADKAL